MAAVLASSHVNAASAPGMGLATILNPWSVGSQVCSWTMMALIMAPMIWGTRVVMVYMLATWSREEEEASAMPAPSPDSEAKSAVAHKLLLHAEVSSGPAGAGEQKSQQQQEFVVAAAAAASIADDDERITLHPSPLARDGTNSAPGSFCDSQGATTATGEDSPASDDATPTAPPVMRHTQSASLAERRQRRRPPCIMDFSASASLLGGGESPVKAHDEASWSWPGSPEDFAGMATPSCSSHARRRCMSPGSPNRKDFKIVDGDVAAILFDFDGTLTASPGVIALRYRKQVELRERAPMLAPRLKALREAGMTLGIISKSSEGTIMTALEAAGLRDLFDGPIIAKAVGLEGKAGFIDDLVQQGSIRHISADSVQPLRRVLLVDDDVYELDRARQRGIQTFSAPVEGGLQEHDFDEIFKGLGVSSQEMPAAQ